MRHGVEPGHGIGMMGTGAGHHDTGLMGTGVGHHDTGMMGTGVGHPQGTGMGAGHHGTALGGIGMGGLGGTAAGHEGASGFDAEGKETMGHKIKKHIPGVLLRGALLALGSLRRPSHLTSDSGTEGCGDASCRPDRVRSAGLSVPWCVDCWLLPVRWLDGVLTLTPCPCCRCCCCLHDHRQALRRTRR